MGSQSNKNACFNIEETLCVDLKGNKYNLTVFSTITNIELFNIIRSKFLKGNNNFILYLNYGNEKKKIFETEECFFQANFRDSKLIPHYLIIIKLLPILESNVSLQSIDCYLNPDAKIHGGLWPEGKILYSLHSNLSKNHQLKNLLLSAIEDWNITNKGICEYIPINSRNSQNYFVTFHYISQVGSPSSLVGCYYNKIQSINLCYKYPSGEKIRKACILREMMHCAGFHHEHCRYDRDIHCEIGQNFLNDVNYEKTGRSLSTYDYYSLMHYCEISKILSFKSNEELRRLADKFNTFSKGDKAAIKIMYGGKGVHHGTWHNKCLEKCTDLICYCGSCSNENEINCGYNGYNGHWSCCMNEDFDSKCMVSHTGMWHAACIGRGCTNDVCSCNNCGGGCVYKGMKANWSCCCLETFEKECTLKFKKTIINS